MSLANRHKEAPRKKAKRGFAGYPVATLAYYGPDDRFASKVAVGIDPREGGRAGPLERWFNDDLDVRLDLRVQEQILRFVQLHEGKTVVMPNKIIGCPHETTVADPEGENSPKCPFWADRDRWAGVIDDEDEG